MGYGYTPEQHAAVDAELETMWTRLIELAVEIDKLAAPTGKGGRPYTYACQAADAIRDMRAALAQDLKYRKEGEEYRRRMGKG